MENNKFNALLLYISLIKDDYKELPDEELVNKLNEHFSKSQFYPFIEQDMVEFEIEKEMRMWTNELENVDKIIKYYGNEGAAELYN